MHKDLDDSNRSWIDDIARSMALSLVREGESLDLAREAWINAFDKAAEELDGGVDADA